MRDTYPKFSDMFIKIKIYHNIKYLLTSVAFAFESCAIQNVKNIP